LLVADVINEYVEFVMPRKRSTRGHYDEKNYIRNRILPAFGASPVKTFDVMHMDEVYKAWMIDPIKPIKPGTVRRIHAILSVAFTEAMKRRRIGFDPTKLVTLPASDELDREWLSRDEVQAFLAAVQGERDWARWAIALTMGLRQGEVLGLRWRDIDFSPQEMTVRHSLTRRTITEHVCGGVCGRKYAGYCTSRWEHGCGGTCGRPSAAECRQRQGQESLILGSTKERRVKALPIPNGVFAALMEHWESQNVLRGIAGDDWWDLDFVFADQVGRPLDPRGDNRAWKRYLKAAGLPDTRLHDARHATGSGLDSVGTTQPTIKTALGHSSTRVTERYVHTSPAGVRDAFETWSQAVMPTSANASEPPRIETETETGFGLQTLRPNKNAQNMRRRKSRLGDLNPRPTHYECVALPLS